MLKDLVYTEHFYRHAYHKDKTLLEWAIIWFKTSNDGFYKLYGFNFNPFDYPNLYEIARKIVHGKYAQKGSLDYDFKRLHGTERTS